MFDTILLKILFPLKLAVISSIYSQMPFIIWPKYYKDWFYFILSFSQEESITFTADVEYKATILVYKKTTKGSLQSKENNFSLSVWYLKLETTVHLNIYIHEKMATEYSPKEVSCGLLSRLLLLEATRQYYFIHKLITFNLKTNYFLQPFKWLLVSWGKARNQHM